MGKKILVVSRAINEFIKRDVEILKRKFSVKALAISSPLSFFNIFKNVLNTDIIFIWFAGWYNVIPTILGKILNKRIVVVGGGFDCMWINKNGKVINLEMSGWKELLTRISAKLIFNSADYVIPVSKFAKKGLLKISKPKRIKIIYNGVPIPKSINFKKEDIVITVGYIGPDYIKKKGLMFFTKVAKQMPDVKFYIIGGYEHKEYNIINNAKPKNLILTGYIVQKQLVEFYKRAKVYCQLSYSESFGVALAEAMSFGCIPLVTKRTALPEVVGNVGYYVKWNDVKNTVKIIRNVLKKEDSKLMNEIRNQIKSNFSLEKRGRELIKLLENILVE